MIQILPSQFLLLGFFPLLQTPSFPSPFHALALTHFHLTTQSLSAITLTCQLTPQLHHGSAFEQVSPLPFLKSVGAERVLTKLMMIGRVEWPWDTIIVRVLMLSILTI